MGLVLPHAGQDGGGLAPTCSTCEREEPLQNLVKSVRSRRYAESLRSFTEPFLSAGKNKRAGEFPIKGSSVDPMLPWYDPLFRNSDKAIINHLQP